MVVTSENEFSIRVSGSPADLLDLRGSAPTTIPGAQRSGDEDGRQQGGAGADQNGQCDHRPGGGEQAGIAHGADTNRDEKKRHVGEYSVTDLAEVVSDRTFEMEPDQQRGHSANRARNGQV